MNVASNSVGGGEKEQIYLSISVLPAVVGGYVGIVADYRHCTNRIVCALYFGRRAHSPRSLRRALEIETIEFPISHQSASPKGAQPHPLS